MGIVSRLAFIFPYLDSLYISVQIYDKIMPKSIVHTNDTACERSSSHEQHRVRTDGNVLPKVRQQKHECAGGIHYKDKASRPDLLAVFRLADRPDALVFPVRSPPACCAVQIKEDHDKGQKLCRVPKLRTSLESMIAFILPSCL